MAARAAAAPAPRRARRLPVRMSGARAVPRRPGDRAAIRRVRARASARDRLPARRLGTDPERLATGSSRATSRSQDDARRAARRAAAALQEGPGVGRARALAARVPGGRSAGRHAASRRSRSCGPRATLALGDARVLAVISPTDYSARAAGLRHRLAAAALDGAHRRRPGRAAGRLAQDLEQPLPQPEEGRQGRLRLPRGHVRRGTCRASTGCTCARCASTARCRAACASSS